MERRRFIVAGVDPVVADVGGGEDDDLTGVAGVGENLLIAGHAGMEDDLSAGRDRGTEEPARKDASGFEGKRGEHAHPFGAMNPGSGQIARTIRESRQPCKAKVDNRTIINGSGSSDRRGGVCPDAPRY